MAETTADMQQKKGLLKTYLDKTFGDEGLKTDVKITLTPQTMIVFAAGIVGAVILGSISFYMIKSMFQAKPGK